MTSLRLLALAAASGIILAACAPPAEQTPAAEPPPVQAAEEEMSVTPESAPAPEAAPAEECAVLDSRDWEAWIDRMPGPDASPTVHVIGKVDVRSGGYTFNWEVGPMDRSMTPALNLKLIPVAPTEPATMAIATEEVHYTGPLAGSSYSRVTITCGGQTLGEISEVTDAH
ncbi:hypothetical protein BBF93_09755 [Hyphomonas sp. CACIAM 19H1]|uniref:hypothetical protein n=1 Tax=Hyphomonas sp. CACIAM 19H1 TaxID=1873716 RepID=UPI000DEDC019|nr:hypothetical protein [Hyphomonas sp. CACIAM 19H1]AXE64480.1 hypothetical protein BBF93_09755 [Hyphomonas sp. CACIAM 19H1]